MKSDTNNRCLTFIMLKTEVNERVEAAVREGHRGQAEERKRRAEDSTHHAKGAVPFREPVEDPGPEHGKEAQQHRNSEHDQGPIVHELNPQHGGHDVVYLMEREHPADV